MAQPTPWRHALVVAMLAVLLLLPCGRPRCAAAADAADSASSSASSSSSSSSSSSRRSRLRGRRHALPPALQQPQPDAAAAGLWRDCPGVPHNWLPECWVAVHARVQIGGDRTFYWTPFSSPRWGNALSPYWQARALALLAGHGFHGYDGFDNTSWLGYLPKQVPPTTCPQMARFAQACDQCDSASWAYAHRCAGAWVWIQPTIVGDTRRAFGAWAAAVGYTPPPPGGPRDAVIQSRCSRDTLLSHDEYGPLAFSAYAALPSDTARITLVSDPHARVALCGRIHAALRAWLRARFPAAVVDAAGGQAHEDFARLLHAPRLFKDASSSFGLWAALANAGDVWAVPLLRRFTNNTRPDLGPSWHWVDAPVLYPHDIDGRATKLSQYAGKVVLVVNLALACGFTPQYAELQQLYSKFASKGLVVLGFSCNQFGAQEPGSNTDIKSFAKKNYGVTFPLMAKVEVNGQNADPVFDWLKQQKGGFMTSDIKWNFSKFLLNRDGEVVGRYGSTTTPAQIEKDILKYL